VRGVFQERGARLAVPYKASKFVHLPWPEEWDEDRGEIPRIKWLRAQLSVSRAFREALELAADIRARCDSDGYVPPSFRLIIITALEALKADSWHLRKKLKRKGETKNGRKK